MSRGLSFSKKSIIWSGLYLLLLLSLIIPPVNAVTIHLLLVPLIVLYVILEPKWFAIHIIPLLIITFVLLGPFGAIFAGLTILVLVPAIVMGHLYKQKAAIRAVITGGIVALLGEMLLSLLIANLAGVNLRSFFAALVEDSLASLKMLMPEPFADVTAYDLAGVMIQMLPLYMIVFSIYYIFINHWVSRFALVRMGFSIPGLKPLREWMLPKAVVWYYLAALVMDLFVSRETNSTLAMILANSIPLLMFLFSIQAISFFFFLAHAKGWSLLLPIVMIVPILLFSPLSIIGVMDVAFPIRKAITKQGL